jgi:uroporphyrinogen-III decarboxylase
LSFFSSKENDDMKPKQRLLAAIRGEPVDRVPIWLEAFQYENVGELEDETKRSVVERAIDYMHYNVPVPTYINRYLVTPPQFMTEVAQEERADGSIITTRAIQTPKGTLTAITGRNAAGNTVWTIKYPCESVDDIEAIRSIPWEMPEGLAPPDLSDLPESFDARGILRAGVSSPFVCVAGMMPFQMFFEMCATHFDLIQELTDICLDRILQIMDVVFAEHSVEYMWMGGSEWVTPPMSGPAIYDALVQPYEETVIKRAHDAGAVVHVHCHGNVCSTLEQTIARGADFFEPVEPPPDGDITFAEAKKIAAGRMTLGGNIEARVLENGTLEEVEAACRRAFEGGKERMVFQTTAGPIKPISPEVAANYHKLLDVWEELSPIEPSDN